MGIVLIFVSVILLSLSFGNAFAGKDTATATELCNENLVVAERACTADLYFADFSKCLLDAKTTWRNTGKMAKVQNSESNQNNQLPDTKG